MRNSHTLFLAILCFLTFSAEAAFSQVTIKNADGKKVKISVKKGDRPPGDMSKMPLILARVTMRDLLSKRHLVSYAALYEGHATFEANNIRLNDDGLSFDYDSVSKEQPRITNRAEVIFKKLDYVKVKFSNHDRRFFYIAYIDAKTVMEFAWKEERVAQRFADALNRWIYEAHYPMPLPDFSNFADASKNWREKSESRAKAPDGWDRYRILAEQAIKERNYLKALENYEAALEEYPVWPEGWFNAALIYSEVGEFGSAASRMKHYLELMPDASDSQTAREKIIIWEDKARP